MTAISATDVVSGLGNLRVALVADVLQRMGYRDQVMQGVAPITGQPLGLLAGTAFPIQVVASHEEPDNPYAAELAAVDAVPAGAVLCFAAAGVNDAAIWGELLATRARAKGAIAAAIDGAVRDIAGLLEMGFPTFARAVSPNDAFGRARVAEYGSPVVCGGVAVGPDDFVVADPDGVVVVPGAAAIQVVETAREREGRELAARADLLDGVSAEEVYARYKTL
jgi:4-hydroxy-4-methyl-2-oxoglutarate aldolase